MGRDLRVGVAGATGSIGRELLAVLDEAPWRPDTVVAMAAASSSTPFVEYGDQQLTVEDLANEDLEGLDALLVALPREAARPVVDRAVAAGVPVVDCTGSSLDDLGVPVVVPWVNGEALEAGRTRDVVTIPSAAALLVASVLAPLVRRGWSGGADATVLLPASTWGRHAIDELSRQVVAMFNAATPPRRIFPHGLAFDVLPLVGELGATGWSGEEVRVTAEIGRMTGRRTSVTLIGAPVFSGISADLRLSWPAERDPEELASWLGEAGLEVASHGDVRRLPRPRRVEGSVLPQVARIRRGLAGDEVHLWASTDNLRATAAAAVGALAVLLGQRAGEGDAR